MREVAGAYGVYAANAMENTEWNPVADRTLGAGNRFVLRADLNALTTTCRAETPGESDCIAVA